MYPSVHEIVRSFSLFSPRRKNLTLERLCPAT
jgi:hypothetical protein